MNETYVTLAGSAALAVGIAAFVRQRGWSIALPLIGAGVVVGAVPWGLTAPPDPEVVLVAILAPLVFGEALGSSYIDLRKVSRPVLALAIGLVIASTLVVGALAVTVVAMPLAMAFALGAVLSPTDAVAVSTVARRAGLPRRLVSILEGESLVNDGTGLTALKVALVAAAAGSVTLIEVTGMFVVAVVAGVVVGGIGGWLLAWMLRRSKDLVASNALILVAPFLLYVLAEQVDGSGILAVVVAALVIAHSQNSDPGHSGRVQSVIGTSPSSCRRSRSSSSASNCSTCSAVSTMRRKDTSSYSSPWSWLRSSGLESCSCSACSARPGPRGMGSPSAPTFAAQPSLRGRAPAARSRAWPRSRFRSRSPMARRFPIAISSSP
jgi:hypothetical protein